MTRLTHERGLTEEERAALRRRDGAALREHRHIRGLTQQAFAEALNAAFTLTLDRRKINDFETGRRPVPPLLAHHFALRR